MPYISQEKRKLFSEIIAEIEKIFAANITEDDAEGCLNYIITNILCRCIKRSFEYWRYKHINRVKGVLASVRDEFERRIAGPYEDGVINKNGDLDVFSHWI